MFNGPGVPVGIDEKVLEMGGGKGRTTTWIYLMPQNRTLERG